MSLDVREAFEDLLTIEINIIEKHGMTARKQPSFPWQLMEIISTYSRYMEQRGICVELVNRPDAEVGLSTKNFEIAEAASTPYLKAKPKNGAVLDEERVTNGWTTFEKIRVLAKAAYKHEIDGLKIKDEEQRIILQRIRRNCDHIKNILMQLQNGKNNGLKEFVNLTEAQLIAKTNKGIPCGFRNVPFSYLTTVRKIWEVGVETVLMQTVVQAEGDIITRISPRMADMQIHADLREAMLGLHRSSMDVGLSHWKNMIEIILKLASKLFS